MNRLILRIIVLMISFVIILLQLSYYYTADASVISNYNILTAIIRYDEYSNEIGRADFEYDNSGKLRSYEYNYIEHSYSYSRDQNKFTGPIQNNKVTEECKYDDEGKIIYSVYNMEYEEESLGTLRYIYDFSYNKNNMLEKISVKGSHFIEDDYDIYISSCDNQTGIYTANIYKTDQVETLKFKIDEFGKMFRIERDITKSDSSTKRELKTDIDSNGNVTYIGFLDDFGEIKHEIFYEYDSNNNKIVQKTNMYGDNYKNGVATITFTYEYKYNADNDIEERAIYCNDRFDCKECYEYVKWENNLDYTAGLNYSPINVVLNDGVLAFDQPPIIVDGRTLVPLRAIFEAIGATVDWNQSTKTVTSKKGNTTISLTIGSNALYKNGASITLDVPAQIVNNRTLVPVRAVSEAFGAEVNWDNNTKTVTINYSDNAV